MKLIDFPLDSDLEEIQEKYEADILFIQRTNRRIIAGLLKSIEREDRMKRLEREKENGETGSSRTL